ncbi:MAG: GNAT family N-acetyltransferase [Faecousia sp.]
MDYVVRRAKWEDLERIGEIYAYARAFMAEHGNPNQWGTSHPPRAQLEQDIEKGDLYVITDDRGIHGVFYFFIGDDPTYSRIDDGGWHDDRPYGTIHRIASDGSGGILGAAVVFGKCRIDYLRIDTHEDNKVMQSAVEKQGFRRCGIIYQPDGSPRIAYDLSLIRRAETRDISRMAEILVFTKRVNFRPIFHNDDYSFGELQVLTVAQTFFDDPGLLKEIWVYDDGFVKGLIHVTGKEVKELYVDSFFEGQGIGGQLLDFAITRFGVQNLWVLEKNPGARAFYKCHGFRDSGIWKYEEGTTERLLRLER